MSTQAQSSSSPAQSQPTPGDLIQRYIELRDYAKTTKEQFDKWLADAVTNEMDQIEAQLLGFLDAAKSDSIKASGGTAYRAPKVSVTVSDQREFQRHVIGSQEWELVDWRANKTVIREIVDKGDPPPPGVNYSTKASINVRRS